MGRQKHRLTVRSTEVDEDEWGSRVFMRENLSLILVFSNTRVEGCFSEHVPQFLRDKRVQKVKLSHSSMLCGEGHSTNLVDPASCHMLVSRTKPCKCQSTRVLIRGVCVRLIKRFIVSPTKRAVMPSHGISLRNAKLIPVRKIACYQTPRGNLDVWRAMCLAETKIDARTEQL